MAKTETITISVEEYKELLMKERPSDNDKWMLRKIKTFITDRCKLNRDCDSIEIKDYYNFAEDILKFIKLVDLEFYNNTVKRCQCKMEDEEYEKLNKENKENE